MRTSERDDDEDVHVLVLVHAHVTLGRSTIGRKWVGLIRDVYRVSAEKSVLLPRTREKGSTLFSLFFERRAGLCIAQTRSIPSFCLYL